MTQAQKESSAEQFKTAFPKLLPTIQEEWPEVDHAELEASSGELSEVAALIAAQVDRTKQTIRRHLLEILSNADLSKPPPSKHANGATKKTDDDGDGPALPHIDDVLTSIRRLEKFAIHEAERMGRNVVPAAEAKVKHNLFTSLLIALGLGFLLGFIMRGAGRKR